MVEEVSCDWEGPLSAVKKHKGACKFVEVPCPKRCMDEEGRIRKVAKKDMPEHLKAACPFRDFKCTMCGKTGTYTSITQSHLKDCLLENLDAVAVEQDKHSKVAAKLVGEAGKFDYSLDIFHYDLAQLEEWKSALPALMEKIHPPNAHSVMLLHQLLATLNSTFTFKLQTYQRLKETKGNFLTQSFYTRRGGHGYNMVLEVRMSGKYLGIHVGLVEGRSDAELSWPFTGEITFTLLNQCEEYLHYSKPFSVAADLNARQGGAWFGIPDFISHEEIHRGDPKKNVQYLVDDTLYFSVSVKESSKPWLTCTT